MSSHPQARTFWVETLGCPKNQVDSDKLTGTLVADGLAPAAEADDADLVVVNTCAFVEEARQESIDTILALPTTGATGARLVVTGCLAERYGDELAEAAARGRRASPASACRSTARSPSRAPRRAGLRPAQPAPPAVAGAVGLREGGRGLRPGLRVLRHPDASGARSASRPIDVDPRRGRPARRRPRSCSSPRTSPPTAATRAWASGPSSPLVRAAAERVPTGPAAVPVPVRPHRRAGRRRLRHRRALLRPLAPARVRPAAAPHAALGRRRPLPRPHRRHPRAGSPTPPSGRTSSSATRARPRPTTTQLLALRRRGRPRLVRVLRLLRGGRAPTPPASTASVPTGLVAERLAELRRAAGRHHGPQT